VRMCDDYITAGSEELTTEAQGHREDRRSSSPSPLSSLCPCASVVNPVFNCP
jgi:hypothetical protein